MQEKLKLLDQVEMGDVITPSVAIVIDPKAKGYCKLSYYQHPHGCPNFGIKDGCPPGTPDFSDLYESEAVIAASWMNFGQYLELKRQVHPDWKERQLRNLRHWQGRVNSNLRHLVERSIQPGQTALFSPEAMGVDLFATAANAGIYLERTPETIVYKIALLAKPR